ncbi:cytochrome o ubiquinol oxidase subunit IV [Solidesulfovibrio sp.]|uniref:cytochrome o ubiquinol oxidase subunit IV n=1 Tax=Solidesulfovibrio sp. TaxID=2910990 RepID=UPI002B1EB599|nr:cytochrome o ubiquinol oxidase subunit IV [Solidesulfovibrio sp.]MEA4858400.1 cytochrome o ubiquinol oxidase subunit IV [Solidesulfovibrio sp.]
MHQAQQQNGAGVGSLRSYGVGFALSILLTAVSFGLVMTGTLPRGVAIVCLFAAAIAQMLVQLRFFLHLDRSSAMYWNVMSLLFTFFIIFLFVGGSIWIMYGLHYRM